MRAERRTSMSAFALRALGILLMLTALVVALSRAPDRPVHGLVAKWAPPPSDFMLVKGQLVHLRDEGPRGAGPPIVLLHGTASSLHTWEGWVKVLRERHRVITLDLPGFGLTGPFLGPPATPYAADDYRGDTLARFVLDLLGELGVRRFVIGGNSMGGEVAWRIAALEPDRVAKLVLVDASGTAFTPQTLPLGFVVAALPGLNWIGQHLLPRAVVAQGLVALWGDPSRVSAELVDRHYELTLRDGNRRALAQRLQQLERGEHLDRLAALKLPTLILWGGRDRLIPPEVGRELQRLIAGSRLELFPDLGHLPHEEDPAATVGVVAAFVAD